MARNPKPLYRILTWDADLHKYTKQIGLLVPYNRVPWTGMLAAVRRLKHMGYPCDYKSREAAGDSAVLVERLEGQR
jgi:hypothetical protein